MATVFQVDQFYVEYDFLVVLVRFLPSTVFDYFKQIFPLNFPVQFFWHLKFLLLQRPMKRDRELEGRTQHATIASHKGLFSRPLFFVS